MRRRSLRRRAGRSTFGCLVLLILLAAAGYVGMSFGRVYFRYYQFKDDMSQSARFASHFTDAEIVARLAASADSLGLPPEARKVNISRIGKVISISTTYTEIVRLPGLVRAIHFAPTVRSDN